MVLNMYLSQHLGIGEGDIDWAEVTGARLLKNHPKRRIRQVPERARSVAEIQTTKSDPAVRGLSPIEILLDPN